MNITRAAIEKNRITYVAMILVVFAGVAIYLGMSRAEWPPFTIRTATVMTYFPGASPQRVENLVTEKIEKAVQEIPEIKDIRSTSKTGFSLIYVNIRPEYTDMQPIWDRLRRKVNRVKNELPQQVIGPMVNDEFGDVFGTIVSITGEGFSYRELKDVADEVRDQLLLIDEVAKVDIYGAQDERIFVDYNNAQLAELGISTIQLQNMIESRNIIIPGGEIQIGRERLVVEPSGNFDNLDEIKRTIVSVPGRSDLLYLEDIADIYRGYVDPTPAVMHSSGVPSLGLGISMRKGGNIIKLGVKVDTLITQLQIRYPYGIEFDIAAFEPGRVQKSIRNFVKNIGQSVLLVLLVMLVGLGIRTGFLVATLIPMTILLSIMVMNYFGVWLHKISLASLIIALGMLVDNAIVMSESIMVSMQRGKKPLAAALDSAAELKIPLLIASLTTAASFLPIFLAESDVGEYTKSIFQVVTITLLCSWVLSITMIPMLCIKNSKIGKIETDEVYEKKFYRYYRGFLIMILKNRATTIGVVIVIMVLALISFRFVPKMFFPPDDTPIMKVQLNLPVGTSIDYTESVVGKVEKYILDSLKVNESRSEGIVNWTSYIGEGAPRFILSYNPQMASPNYADMILNISSYKTHYRIKECLDSYILNNFPDCDYRVTPMENGPPVGEPVQYRIVGSSIDGLYDIVDKIKARLGGIEGAVNIKDDWGLWAKKLYIRVNQPNARRAGLTSQDIAISLQTQLSGFQTTEYREGDEIIPVTLRSVAAARDDIGKIESMNVYNQMNGRSVPLSQVADIEVVFEPSRVEHYDRRKAITVKADLDGEQTASMVNSQMVPFLDSLAVSWPIGYNYELGGEAEGSIEAQQSIKDKLPIAGFIIVMLLIIQFNSIRKPMIILFSIPLSIIGVIIGLLLFQEAFGFMALLGIVSLAGIVINNAIVLLDRIQIEMTENGRAPADAVIFSSQMRLRPILLTTSTTVGGMIPLYIGGGLLFQPMAITIIFGLLGSTLLTLGMVPVLYSLFYRVDFGDYKYPG